MSHATRALSLLLVVAVVAGGCGKPAPAKIKPAHDKRDPLSVTVNTDVRQALTIGVLSRAEVRETLRVTGRVEVDETRLARVGAPVTGRVLDLQVHVGESVRRGQALATIKSTELSNAQLAFLKAQSQRVLAGHAAERARQLLAAGVIGTAELQRRSTEFAQADADLSAARDQLKVLGMSNAAIAKLNANRSVDSLSHIYSSIDGTVIDRKVTEGQVVQPAESVYLVADLSSVWIVADIPENSAGGIRVGEQIEAEIAALPGQLLHGVLSFVSPTVNPESRTIRARMSVPNPNGLFKPAMLATVLIKGAAQNRHVVPAGAVVRDENRDFVYVQLGENQFQARPVELGPELDGQRVISSGIGDDERIVLNGAFHLNNERKRRQLEGA